MSEDHIAIEFLKWDSDFFGFNIAKAVIDENGIGNIALLPADLKEKQVRVAYIVLNKWSEETNRLLLEAGAKFVDKKTTYSKTLDPGNKVEVKESYPVVPYRPEFYSQDMVQLAYDSGHFSRFLVDEGFGRRNYEKLYLEWLKKSISKVLADEVWVAVDQDKPIGFITAKKDKDNSGQIGLIAVSSDYRGKKIGHGLMAKCEDWYFENGFQTARVVTQGQNLSACRFYESFGYAVEKVEYYYHLWT
jgi:dTDP-4-amino-4,6-dideoxy-D-galactose acyltransferase